MPARDALVVKIAAHRVLQGFYDDACGLVLACGPSTSWMFHDTVKKFGWM